MTERGIPKALGVSGTITVTSQRLIVEQREGVLIIRFNRPAARNAFDRTGYKELLRALFAANGDDSVRIIVLTGAGDVFTAGNDLLERERTIDDALHNRATNFLLRSLCKSILNSPKVTVALVNGLCIGIGFTLAALCDVVYCTETAYFQAPFSLLGICPEACSSYSLPAIMGRSKASEVLMFGKRLSAAEALRCNFVADIWRQEDLETVFWPQLVEWSRLPVKSLRAAKRLTTRTIRDAHLSALKAELDELVVLRAGEAHRQAVAKFAQRRSKL